MLKTNLKHRFAQSARAKSSQQNIGIQNDSHDIALNTSSSVSSPAASANGRVFPRSDWNFRTERYCRRESRTIALKGLFCSAQTCLSSLRKSSDNRIVKVFIMY